MRIEEFIYEFNLVSTLTVTDTYEWCYVINNRIDREIDYENSVSFYHLVESFNKLYLKFKNDYDRLTKLNLGDKLEILKFGKWEYNGSNYRKLVIYVDNPNKEVCDDYDTLLYLYEKDGEVSSYVTNNLLPWEEGYYKKYLELDNQLVKSYLDLGDKYVLVIDSYNSLKNNSVFGNGTTCLFSKINGELLEGLSTFELAFGNNYFNTSDYINLVFKLGDNLEIDYDKSLVKIRSEYMDKKKEIIDKLIHNLFVSKSKISKMYCDSDVKKLLK